MSSAVFCVTSSDLVVTSRLFCKVSSSDTCNIEMYVSIQTELVLLKICVQNVSLLYSYEGLSICNENSPVYPKVLYEHTS